MIKYEGGTEDQCRSSHHHRPLLDEEGWVLGERRGGAGVLNRQRRENKIIVFKLGSDIDSAGVLSHWVNGRTTESMIESD